jgi:phosphoglycerol transferase MdoB-like AlkP superfamily enzyme
MKSIIINALNLLGIYAICRLVFYGVNIDYFTSVTPSNLLTMCIGGIRFDLVAIIYLNLLYILLASLPFKFRALPKYQLSAKIIYFVCNAIGIIINLCDVVYFRFINKRTTIHVFSEFKNDNNLLKIFGLAIVEYWYLFLLGITLLIWLWYSYRKIEPTAWPNTNKKYYTVHTLSFLFIVLFSIVGIRGTFIINEHPIGINAATLYINQPLESAVVLNTPFTFIRSIGKDTYKNPNYFSTQEEVEKYCNPIHTPQDSVPFTAQNVVVLIVESLSSEYVGILNKTLDNGTYEGYTPFIDSLITKSLTFKHTFANGSQSVDAMPSVLSGIPRLIAPFTTTQYATNEIESLAKYLKSEGYSTYMYHGGTNGTLGFNAYAKSAGFDHYLGRTEYNNDEHYDGTWAIWDEEYLQYCADEMNKQPEPFLTTIFTATSHHPFVIPERYNGKFKQGPHEVYQSIAYTDYAIKRFFEKISKMPWYKNTLFIITGDHTNTMTHPEFMNARGVYSIPILFYHPSDSSLAREEDMIFSQIDVTPTVLGYLHYNKPYFSFGQDFFRENVKEKNLTVNYTEPIFIIYKDSMLLQFDGKDCKAMYNFAKDKALSNNIKGQYPEMEDEMLTYLKAYIQQYIDCIINNKLTTDRYKEDK